MIETWIVSAESVQCCDVMRERCDLLALEPRSGAISSLDSGSDDRGGSGSAVLRNANVALLGLRNGEAGAVRGPVGPAVGAFCGGHGNYYSARIVVVKPSERSEPPRRTALMLEARDRSGAPVYAAVHANERSSGYPLDRPGSTSPPGAILSSHVERSWGFRATVLAGLHISRVYLGSRRMPKGQASKQEAVIGTRSTDRDSLPWDWSGVHPSVIAAPAWASVLSQLRFERGTYGC